ncbi:hypothetical protein C8Q74DRAFT_200848 [Fomes fomentarius]|nr:hypothetical protein C8Q74DRAFT_200848 [Fomes fomentarius]
MSSTDPYLGRIGHELHPIPNLRGSDLSPFSQRSVHIDYAPVRRAPPLFLHTSRACRSHPQHTGEFKRSNRDMPHAHGGLCSERMRIGPPARRGPSGEPGRTGTGTGRARRRRSQGFSSRVPLRLRSHGHRHDRDAGKGGWVRLHVQDQPANQVEPPSPSPPSRPAATAAPRVQPPTTGPPPCECGDTEAREPRGFTGRLAGEPPT